MTCGKHRLTVTIIRLILAILIATSNQSQALGIVYCGKCFNPFNTEQERFRLVKASRIGGTPSGDGGIRVAGSR